MHLSCSPARPMFYNIAHIPYRSHHIYTPTRCNYLAAVIPADQKGMRLKIWWEIVSPLSNPMMAKLDELLWFCNDFQKLNKVSNFEIYLMPWVEKLVESLRRLHFSSNHKLRTCHMSTTMPWRRFAHLIGSGSIMPFELLMTFLL